MNEEGVFDDVARGADVDRLASVAVHAALAPDEMLMMAEEADERAPEDWTIGEVFRRILCFVFFDGRSAEGLGWDYAAAALEVLYREFCPSFLLSHGEDGSARRRGVGLVSGAGRGVDEMVREVPEALVASVLLRMGAGLEGRLWMVELTRRFYALAKVCDEGLIGGASLERLGDIFGEGNRPAARARWSARVHQVLRELGGQRAQELHGRYMKCDGARERMREAARGNQNRKAEKRKS